jgi:hypothetical protein
MARFREGTGTAIAVAAVSVTGFVLLAWVFAFLLWLAFSIYAIVELIGDGRPSALAISLIVVGLLAGLVTLLGVGIWQVGKRTLPAKRDLD